MKKNICIKRNMCMLGLIGAITANSISVFAETSMSNTEELVELVEFNALDGVVRTETSDLFSNRDFKVEYNDENYTSINLVDNASSVINSNDGVSIVGNTINITKEGTYELSGSLTDGQVVINCDKADKVQLVLNGVTINNSNSACIYVEQADKVFITTLNGTSSNLRSNIPVTEVNEEEVSEDDTASSIDAVIFSREDITLNGEGALNLVGTNGHGITSKDEVRITSGIYNINAGKHAIEANDAVKIAGGKFNIIAQKDGIHANNSSDDSLGFVHIFDGDFIIKAQDDGIECNGYLTLEGGNFNIDAQDDALHTNNDLTIFGGNYEISSVDDAIHADVRLVIYDGDINIVTSYEGLEGQMIDIHGGNISMYCNDDGINAAMKSDGTTTEQQFGGGGGMRPEGMNMMGNMTALTDLTDEQLAEIEAMMLERQNGGQLRQEPTIDLTGQQPLDMQQGQMGQQMQGQIDMNQMMGQMGQQPMDMQQGQMGQQMQGQIDMNQKPQDLVISDLTNLTNLDVTTADTDVDTTVYINITGGNIYINSNSEGDGLDSNGNITISGGTVYVSSTTDERDTALDYSKIGYITGGTFIGAGSNSRTVQNFGTNSTQASIVVVLDSLVNFDNIPDGESKGFTLADSTGTIIAEFEPAKNYQEIIISTPDLVVGETYTLTTPLGIKTINLEDNLYTESAMNMGMNTNMKGNTQSGQQRMR